MESGVVAAEGMKARTEQIEKIMSRFHSKDHSIKETEREANSTGSSRRASSGSEHAWSESREEESSHARSGTAQSDLQKARDMLARAMAEAH